jgi:hypothetical protein
VCDPDVALGQLVGRNKAYIDERLPHVAQLMQPDWELAVGKRKSSSSASGLPIPSGLRRGAPRAARDRSGRVQHPAIGGAAVGRTTARRVARPFG